MKTILKTDKAPEPIGPYNQAVKVGNTLYASGQLAINPGTGEIIKSSIEEETKQVMENFKAILREADMIFENVVKCTIFIKDMNQFSKINSVYGTYFNQVTAPARETIEVARLPMDANVEISFIAIS